MLSKMKGEWLVCFALLSVLHTDRGVAQGNISTSHTNRTINAPVARPDSAQLERQYTHAVDLFDAGQYDRARVLFSAIASNAGIYRDTASYLEKISKRTASASESDKVSKPGADSQAPLTESDAKDAKAPKGGQAAPSPASGGLSSAERTSRVLMDGRKAFQEGNLAEARKRFEEALRLDSDNVEARKYLGDIERKSGGEKLAPSASGDLGSLRSQSAIGADLLPVLTPKAAATASKVDVPAAPATKQQESAPVAFAAPEVKVVKQQVDRPSGAQLALNATVAFESAQTIEEAKPAGQVQAFGAPTVSERKSLDEPEAKEVAKADAPATAAPKKADAADKSNTEQSKKEAEPKKEVAAKPAPESAKPGSPSAKSESTKEVASAVPVLPTTSSNESGNTSKQQEEAPRLVSANADKKVADSKSDSKPAAEKSNSKTETKTVAENLVNEPSLATAAPVVAAKPATAEKAQPAAKEVASADKPVDAPKKADKAVKEVAAPAPSATSTNTPVPEKKQKEMNAAIAAIKKAAEDAQKMASESKEQISTLAKTSTDLGSKVTAAGTTAGSGATDDSAKLPGLPEAENTDKNATKADRAKAAATTDEGIKLFNDGKISEALEKFSLALNSDSKYKEAEQYKARAEKRLEEQLKKDTKVLAQAPAPSLPALPEIQSSEKPAEKKDEKKDAINLDSGKSATSDNKGASTELKPLSEVLNQKPVEETKSESTSSDPKLEADKLLRQAQRELKDGNRTQARATAEKALGLDSQNVEIKALVDELSGNATTPSPSKSMASSSTGTAKPVGSKSPVGVDGLLTEARTKFESGRAEEALKTFKSVIDIDPENEVAKRYIADIEGGRSAQRDHSKATSAAVDREQAEAAFQKGLSAYEQGRLDVAVQWWNYSLTLDPNQPRAIDYLQRTGSEYEAWVQQHQYNAVQLQKEVISTEKLDTTITYDTAGQKSIVEFLNAMALIADISFYVAEGVDPEINVTAKFEETPLHDALDIVLLPIGLKWQRTADAITITADLRTKFFNLTPEQVARLKGLLENKTLQRYLYGPEALPAMRNVELTLDDRENLLVVTDSQENINKIEAFLKDMQLTSPPGLIYKSWKIRATEGEKIKALVEAIVKVQSDAPYDLERKVVVDGDDLIVKDTADNIAKIEQLLLDKNFLRKLETQKLNVVTFNLTPKEPIQDNIEQVRDLANNIVTVIKTILYSQSTESAAAAEGRRYWYDPNTLQLTIVDFPENLRVVSDYIRSLPMIGGKLKSEILFLKHQTASDLASLLERVLGISGGAAETGGDSGAAVTKTLRVEGELKFRDISLRVTRIEENDAIDENDDSVEMVIRTARTSEDRTIEEFRSEFIEDYEVNVIEVRPSGTPGEGSARIEIRYNPQGGFGAAGGVAPVGAVTPVGGVGVAGAPVIGPNGQIVQGAVVAAPVETDLTVDPIENMNALLIRYSDPSDLAEVKGWIEQLDIPVLQVNIETKLVEVNETRAKEFMPEFNILNLNKSDVDWENSNLDMRFAQTQLIGDEFRDTADPFPENIGSAGLPKAMTVLNFLATAGDTPINFTLRALEAEGVVSVVNGPHVVVENGETADFEINRLYGNLPALRTGGTNIGTAQQITQQTLQQVALSVTPQITQLGEIRLEIENLELTDFGEDQGEVTFLDINGVVGDQPEDPHRISTDVHSFPNRRQRSLQTVARVHNGGTIVLGGWNGEHSRQTDAGVPILRNIPYIGKLLFNRTSDRIEKTTLLIFLTCHLIDP